METTVYGDIYVVPSVLEVCDKKQYDVEGITGNQLCFEAFLMFYDNYKLSKKFSKKIPVELFKDKKEGDLVEICMESVFESYQAQKEYEEEIQLFNKQKFRKHLETPIKRSTDKYRLLLTCSHKYTDKNFEDTLNELINFNSKGGYLGHQ